MTGVAKQADTPDRPTFERFAPEHGPLVRDVDRVDDCQHIRMPRLEIPTAFLDRSRLRPAFDQPIIPLDRGDKVQQLTAPQRVGDDMAVGADPGHAVLLAEPRRQPFHRHDATPGHEAGKRGMPVPE